jgi:hypothetical protein
MVVRCALFVCLSALVAGGCGSGKPSGGDGDGGTLDYFPLAIGTSWTYKITDAATAVVKEKANTVEAYEDAGGAKAGTKGYRIVTDKLIGSTTGWYKVDGAILQRLREEEFDAVGLTLDVTYEPYKLRLDTSAEHTTLGATWTETYTENGIDYTTSSAGTALTPKVKAEQWTVQAVDESVTVPAGTFACLHIHRVNLSGSGKAKDYFYALGVGKIKEAGSGQTEELVSYSLP